MAKFNLGHTVMTRGVNENIMDGSLSMDELVGAIHRHQQGDWGDTCKEDAQMNDRAVESGDDRIFSVYIIRGTKYYIITEWDRLTTTVLLPSEY